MGKSGARLYKILGMASGIAGSMLAGAVFQRVWKLVARQDSAPEPLDEERRWREVLPAAVLKGAMAGAMRATVQRGQAVGMRRATGSWPD